MPAKNLILGALISVYFLPTILFVIPLFVILVSYQLDDTILSLVVPYTAFTLPFVIWILKTFIDKLPIEVEEAAKIDGCSVFQLLSLIIFPLLRPGLIAAFILMISDTKAANSITSSFRQRRDRRSISKISDERLPANLAILIKSLSLAGMPELASSACSRA